MATLRNYLNDTQYQAITGQASLGNQSAADAAISQAEAIIDGYVGTWQKARTELTDAAQAAAVDAVTISAVDASGLGGVDYLKGMVIEFLNGDAEGVVGIIKTSSLAGLLTFYEDLSTAPSAGDLYRIYQLGKFPRRGKTDLLNKEVSGVNTYFLQIPRLVKEAVAWQVLYMNTQGASFFDSAALNMNSESFGKYSYSRGENAQGGKAIIAPKARQVLAGAGLIKRTGRLEV